MRRSGPRTCAATTSLADTYTSAYASWDNAYDLDTDGHYWEIWVWDAGYYNWSYSLYAYGFGRIRGSGSASGSHAAAQAIAEVTSPAGNDTASVSVQIPGAFDDDYDTDYVEGSGTHQTYGKEVVLDFDEYSRSEAVVSSPTIIAQAKAYTTASGSVTPQ